MFRLNLTIYDNKTFPFDKYVQIFFLCKWRLALFYTFYIYVIIRYAVNHLYGYLSEEKAFYVWLTEYKIDVK